MSAKKTKSKSKDGREVTVGQIANAYPVLSKFYDSPLRNGLLSLKLGLFLKEIGIPYSIQEETRNKLIVQYGEEVEIEDEKAVQVKDENTKQFHSEMAIVYEETVVVSDFSLTMTDIAILADVAISQDGIKGLSPREMLAIDWLIVDKEGDQA